MLPNLARHTRCLLHSRVSRPFNTIRPRFISNQRHPYRICVVGSGPAGFYTAESLMKMSNHHSSKGIHKKEEESITLQNVPSFNSNSPLEYTGAVQHVNVIYIHDLTSHTGTIRCSNRFRHSSRHPREVTHALRSRSFRCCPRSSRSQIGSEEIRRAHQRQVQVCSLHLIFSSTALDSSATSPSGRTSASMRSERTITR